MNLYFLLFAILSTFSWIHDSAGATEKSQNSCQPRTDPNNYCMKSCQRNSNCRKKRKKRNRKKKCLCDGECGLSCIKKNLECVENPPQLRQNGYMKVGDKRYDDSIAYRFGDTITYHCRTGFTLSGPAFVRCSGVGKWKPFNKGKPICSKRCPDVEDPTNGRVIGGKFNVNDFVFFRCFPGYSLVGEPKLRCQRNLKWNGNPPTCQVKFCNKIDVPENAKIYSDIRPRYQFGSRVVLRCVQGHFRQGSNIIECIGNRFRYLGTQLKCLPKSCGNPGTLWNGRREGSLFRYKKVVKFSCNLGYRIEGATYRVCEANQRWSGKMPVCKKVVCGMPPFLHNGKYESFGYEFGDTQEIKCNTGFVANGPAEITCTEKGLWSANVICTAITCSKSEVTVANAKLKRSNSGNNCTNEYNCKVDFMCGVGYNLVGNSYTVCTETGQWSREPPKCIAIDCGDPKVQHLKIHGETKYGSIVSASCSLGYEAKYEAGFNTRPECQRDGKWRNLPKCEVECNIPLGMESKKIEDKQLTVIGWNSGGLGRFNGNDFCSYWSSTRKPKLVVRLNGVFRITGIKIQISSGYRFSLKVIFFRNGEYLHYHSERITNLKRFENGMYKFTKEVVASKIEFQPLHERQEWICAAFELLGCEEKSDCIPEDDIENGQPIFRGYKTGDELEFRCNSGFIPQPRTRICQDNGKFSSEEVKCIKDPLYVGCLDKRSHLISARIETQPVSCIRKCKDSRFPTALLQGHSCACSHSTQIDQERQSKAVEDLCDLPCSDNRSKTCGGYEMVSVYRTKQKHGFK